MASNRGRARTSGPSRGGASNTKLLRLVLATYGTRCHLCNREGATTMDHLVPWSWTKDNSLENLRPAHLRCNSKRGNRAIPGYGAQVVVVIGPPCGGKTTYIREHAKPHDVIIDLDVLARGLQLDAGPDDYAYPPHILQVARAARRGAIESAMRLARRDATVWLIDSIPQPNRLEDYQFMRYRIVTCDPGYQIARERTARLRPPSFLQGVAKWYSSYGSAAANLSPTPSASPPGIAGLEPSREWF